MAGKYVTIAKDAQTSADLVGSYAPPAGSGSPFDATGATATVNGTTRTLADHLATLPDALVTASGSSTPRSLAARAADVTNARDYASIQAAITAAPTGGVVFVPEGTYALSSGLTINKSLTLRMAKGAVLNCSGLACITVDGTTPVTGVRIEGGTINMTGTGGVVYRYAIQPSGTVSDFTVEGVTINGTGTYTDRQQGIGSPDAGPTLTNVRYLHNTIQGTVIGISLNALTSGSISGALVEGNNVYGVVGTDAGFGYGIHHASSSTDPAMVRIIGNRIVAAQRHSIYQAKGTGVVIANNTILDHRSGTLQGSDTAHGNTRPAIEIARSFDVSVEGGVISGAYDTSIDVTTDGTGTAAGRISIKGVSITDPKGGVYAVTIGPGGDPSVNGFPYDVNVSDLTIANDYAVTANNAALVKVWCGKRITIQNNRLIFTNAPAGVSVLVSLYGYGDSGGTATYNDEIRFIGNTMYAEGAGSDVRAFLLDSAIATSAARLEFTSNRASVTGNVFWPAVTVTNPNVSASGTSTSGLDVSVARMADGAQAVPYRTLTYASGVGGMNSDASQAGFFVVTATDGSAFYLNQPANAQPGQVVSFQILNGSGGALSATSPFSGSAAFKVAAWAQPADGYSRTISLRYTGSLWVEVSRTPADVPN